MEQFSPQLTIHFHAMKETKRQISHVQTRVAKGPVRAILPKESSCFFGVHRCKMAADGNNS
jgi:hypothetical protein